MQNSRPSIPELTARVILLGLVLSVVMGAANVYLGLKAGMTVSASIPAAVVAMVILRRRGTILEANQVQTAASAGESLAAGIIFTMPALVMIGFWDRFDMVLTTLVAFTGGLLGILFMIPMRRVFVTSMDSELKYPEGLACAAVLKAGQEGETQQGAAKAILYGGLVGALYKLLAGFLGVVQSTLQAAFTSGARLFYLGIDVSPALIGVGYIVGLNIAVLVFLGGAIAWLVVLPILSGQVELGAAALDDAQALWKTQIRYMGVGAMVVGGVASIWRVRAGLWRAVQEIQNRALPQEVEVDADRDLPSSAIAAFATLTVFLIGGIYLYLTYAPDIPVGRMALIVLATTGMMLLMAFFFTAVASYIVGLVGNSNSPVSGMTITAVLITGALIWVLGFSGVQAMVATLGVAAVVCCAACTSGDVCNDLKTGHLVGASPYRQQIMQILGVAVASLVMAPVLELLHRYTPGGIGGEELPAPQAGLFSGLVQGFFGDGHLPWDMVGIGVGIGAVMLLIDKLLEIRRSRFRAHVMPIAVGMYLPLGLGTAILAGGILAYLVSRGREGADAERRLRRGVLFSSGAIAGESLMGIGLALLASTGLQRLDKALGLDVPAQVITSATIAAVLLALVLFRLGSRWRNST